LNFNPKIKLIDKYLISQVLATSIVGMTLFVVIWVSPEILFKIIRKVIGHEYTVIQGIKIFLLELPMVLGKAIPMGLLLGCLAVFDNLSKNFELTTLRSVGVSFKRLLTPILVISVIFSFIAYLTFDKFIPYSRQILEKKSGGSANQQFVYVDKDINKKPKKVIIVSNYDGKNISGINVLAMSSDKGGFAPLLRNIYTAPFAVYQNNSIYIKDGTNYKINDKSIFESISKFDSIKILENQKAKSLMELMDFSTKRARNLTNADLSYYLKLLKQEGMIEEYHYNLNKYYQRFFDSVSCIFLAILGCILGYSRPREQRFFGLTAAVGVIFAYYILIPLLDLLAQKGVLPPIITASVPMMIVIGAIFLSLKFKNIDIVK